MSRIGFTSEGDCDIKIKDINSREVNKGNPNYPGNPNSPNYPRGEGRLDAYQNPILGDPGWGEIGRWEKVDTGVLYNMMDQMIAHFLRDREWYGGVRCREALWNIYRRMAWWVEQNVGLQDADHAKALEFIRGCIFKILDPRVEERGIKSLKFVGKMLDDFIYDGEWEIDPYGYLQMNWGEDRWIDDEDSMGGTLTTNVNYEYEGIVTFSFSIEEYAENFKLYLNGIPIWEADSSTMKDDSHTFRDVTVKIPKGEHEFKWEVDKGNIRFDEFRFIEHAPKEGEGKDEEFPYCPPAYTEKYSTDYYNEFTGIPHHGTIFSTTSSVGVGNPLDMIRYVSSKENIEWDRVSSTDGLEGKENILKLPLERLPETLSSKLTFNVRVKRKGHVSFKYLMESGGGSEISLWINNRKATYDLKDSSDWEYVKVNVSQAQTYKFDIVVHKSFSADIGKNAVLVKDIEVVEVIDYTDSPMPGDYTYNGENLTDKWLIYSHKNALASYYRGFPESKEDMVREFEFELYSECDGVFGFGYKLGTEDPDRLYVESEVFRENFQLDESPVKWVGKSNGVGIPSITTRPRYGNWDNYVDGSEGGTAQYVYKTKESTNLKYEIERDKKWDKGEESLYGHITVSIHSPSKYLVNEDYIVEINPGTIQLGRGWTHSGERARFRSNILDEYGELIYKPHNVTGSYTKVDIGENLAYGDRVKVYYGDRLYFAATSGFRYGEFEVMTNPDIEFRVEIEKWEKPPEELEVVFTGAFDFHQGDIEDGRGRYISFHGDVDMEINAWETSNGFTFEIDLKAGEKFDFRLPSSLIAYVNQEKIDEEIGQLKLDNPLMDPERVFYQDFNEYEGLSGIIESEGGVVEYDPSIWELESVFRFLDLDRGSGDGIIGTKVKQGTPSFKVVFDEPLDEDSYHVLSFEYGARFMGGNLEVKAGDETIIVLTEDALRTTGRHMKNLSIPKGTEEIEFIYSPGWVIG